MKIPMSVAAAWLIVAVVGAWGIGGAARDYARSTQPVAEAQGDPNAYPTESPASVATALAHAAVVNARVEQVQKALKLPQWCRWTGGPEIPQMRSKGMDTGQIVDYILAFDSYQEIDWNFDQHAATNAPWSGGGIGLSGGIVTGGGPLADSVRACAEYIRPLVESVR